MLAPIRPDPPSKDMAKLANLVVEIAADDADPDLVAEKGWDAWFAQENKLLGESKCAAALASMMRLCNSRAESPPVPSLASGRHSQRLVRAMRSDEANVPKALPRA